MMLMRFTIVGAALAALAGLTPRGFAQTNAGPPQHNSASRSEEAPPSPAGESDQTLEIAPRAVAPPAAAPLSEPATESAPASDDAQPDNGNGSAAVSPASIPAPDNGGGAAKQER